MKKSLLPYLLFFGMFAFTIYETCTYSVRDEEECERCSDDIAAYRAREARMFAARARPPFGFH